MWRKILLAWSVATTATVAQVMDLTHVEWSWISGSSATADTSLGGKFPSAPFNRPNLRYSPYAREKHSMGQVTIDGVEVDAIYLHGGNYYSSSFQVELLSDLWMFNLTTELWQWIAGNSTNNVAGVYPAAAGESSLDAYPGSRTSRAVVDYNGFILFGGFGYDSKGELTYLNDIWSFDWTTFAWTWINGPSQAVIIEGPTSMTPAMLASYQSGRMNPGGRDEHCIAKTREGTTLYVSGGYGHTTDSAIGLLNDVWSYDLTANTGYWTWLYGSSQIVSTGYAGDGDYSVFGQEDSHVFPRRRLDHACTLSLDESQLYLFGGLAYSLDFAVNSYISMNDFWSLNINSKQWKWISGVSDGNWTEDNTTTVVLGTYDPEYVPSPRHGFGYGVNAEGDLYIYSGSSEFREYEPQRSDMWIYNVTLEKWAQVYNYPSFMGGAVYGPKHEHSANYTPNSREEPSIAVVGNDNYVLVSGGRSIGIGWWSVKSDLWMLTKYCENSNAGSIHFFSSCEVCPAGTHLDAAVGSCVQCPPNTFQNESGQTFCYPCVGSVGSKAYGSVDSSVCLCDAPGYFNGESCKPCPVGTYSKRGAVTVCTQCSKNTYANQTGSGVCLNCPDGYTSTVGASICTVAPTVIVPKTPTPTSSPFSRQTLVKVFGGVAIGLALVAGGFVFVQAKKKRDLVRHISLDDASKSSRSTRKASEAQHLELSVNSVDNSMRRGSWNPEPSSRRRSDQLEARALADDRENSQSSGSSGGASPRFLAAPVSPKSPVGGILKGFGKAATPRSIPENSVDAGDVNDGL